ncbi:MAG: serine hydrolase domain-containing protein [Xanthomonadales bacterium]|nr:serine hydrolase domain-containing protein [Xanthomonadales bacterium]
MSAVIVVTCLLLGNLLAAEEEKFIPASLDELKTAVTDVIREQEVPAVGIAMVRHGEEVWVGSLGRANLEHETPADADTMYRIGSTSKMFVALSVLKLVEQGRLSLEDRVRDLAPEIEFENEWESTDPVRVVHLLEHTTGWDDLHLTEYAHSDPTPATLKEGLDFHPHSRISRWKPGTRMSYCNSGPPVAAYIVEKLTGLDFEDYVQFNFFDPLGMTSATYRMNDDYLERGATLYANGNRPQDYWHIIMRPSGAINASPRDMARFVRFFLARGMVGDWALVSDQSLERMERAESSSGAKAGLEVGYGLHNYSSGYENWVYREHNGGVNGGLTELAYLPQASLGHAIMINSDNRQAFREISRLVRAYETRDLVAPLLEPEHELSDTNREVAGFYYPVNPRQQAAFFIERIFNVQKLWFEAGRLARKPLLDGEPAYYFAVDDHRFKSEKTGLVTLVDTKDPLLGRVVHNGTTVLRPVMAAQVYLQFAILVLWGLFMASSLLFAPVWLVRRLRRKIAPGVTIRLRTWPLLATLSVLVFLLAFAVSMSDPFGQLGSPTVVSVAIMLSTIAFGMFAVFGTMCTIWSRGAGVNRAAYWHSATASVLNAVVAAYLLSQGVIGMMTWA